MIGTPVLHLLRTACIPLLCATLLACGGSGTSGDTGAPPDGGSVPTPPPPGARKALNSYTSDDQQRPVVASNTRGDAVVAWESMGQDGSHLGIFAQRLRNGQPEGAEFQVNQYTDSRQSFVTAAMDAQGGFVIAWRSSLQGSPGGTIFGQRFAADGSRAGSEFRIGPNDSDRDSQSEPQMAMTPSGDFVVVWSNREISRLNEQLGQNQNEERWLEARTYFADGTARAGPKRITETSTDAGTRLPRVAVDAQGRIAFAWPNGTANGTVVRARHFDLDLNPLTPAYSVASATAAVDVDQPSLAINDTGAFAITWETYTYGNRPLGLMTQRFSAPQAAQGEPILIASPDSGLIERTSTALGADGTLWVAAHGQDQVWLTTQTGASPSTAARRLSTPGFASLFPNIRLNGENTALVAWQSWMEDGDRRGIRAEQVSR